MASNRVQSMIKILAESTGQTLSEERFRFILTQTKDIPEPRLFAALAQLASTARTFPTVHDIRKICGVAQPDTMDHAVQIANRILEVIPKVGEVQSSTGGKALKLMLGENASFVVDRMGGWNNVLEGANEGMNALRAQLRETARSYIDTGQIDVKRQEGPKVESYYEATRQVEGSSVRENRKKLEAQLNNLKAVRSKQEQESQAAEGYRLDQISRMYQMATGRVADRDKIPSTGIENFGMRLRTLERHGLLGRVGCVSDVMCPKLALEIAKREYEK